MSTLVQHPPVAPTRIISINSVLSSDPSRDLNSAWDEAPLSRLKTFWGKI